MRYSHRSRAARSICVGLSLGPHPRNPHQLQGSEPAAHRNDPRSRCTECNPMGPSKKQRTPLSHPTTTPTLVLVMQRGYSTIAVGIPQQVFSSPQAPPLPPLRFVGSYAPKATRTYPSKRPPQPQPQAPVGNLHTRHRRVRRLHRRTFRLFGVMRFQCALCIQVRGHRAGVRFFCIPLIVRCG